MSRSESSRMARLQMVLQQGLQAFLAGQACGLKELAQLMDLDLLVHFEEPLAGLFDRLLRRIFQAGFQVGAKRAARSQTRAPTRCTEDGAGALRATPRPDPSFSVSESWFHDPVGDFLGKAGSDGGASAGILQRHHGSFGVQRAVGILQPQPVGKLQRQSRREQTLPGRVPNSITVLSVQTFPSPTTRVKRTGMRTGLASGKNFASLAVQLSCRTRARPVACVGTANTSVLQGRRGLGPQACRLAWQGHPDRIARERLHERGQSRKAGIVYVSC